jgi:PadR family transcriptional regulator AphA
VIAVPGKTEFVILGLLNEQPLSGYEIKKIIDVRFRFFWSESFGQLYPALKKMEKKAWISPLSDLDSRRGKQRYRITTGGQEELIRWLAIPPEKETVRLELLLKMYFSQYGSKADLHNQVLAFRDSHAWDLALLNRFKNELETIPDPFQNHGDILRVIGFGIKANQAYLEWCQETIEYMKGDLHEKKNP